MKKRQKAKLKFNKKKVTVIDEVETPQIKGGATGVLCIPTILVPYTLTKQGTCPWTACA